MDQQGQNGLMRTYREAYRTRGKSGIALGVLLTVFYVVMYFEPQLGFPVFEPVAKALHLDSRWYLYGLLYCFAMIGGAAYYLKHHGNSRYNRIRIGVNVGVQVVLGFTLPFFMHVMQTPDFYFSYFWPLKIEYLYPGTLKYLPLYLAIYSVVASLIAVPLLAYFFGKRWYCSWVCGCGGLANTFGDPYRHLTSKSTKAWRFEQASIYVVTGLALLTTGIVGVDFFAGYKSAAFHAFAVELKWYYGFFVGQILAGVVGVGFYPIFGPRVWCRNFCPMAAMLGLMQKVGRFRIRVKPDMCISCGNCSTYCEMGIDVRSYAQSNQSFTRSACVGCGMCAHVCPRGVLRLENASPIAADKTRQRLPVLDL